MPHRLLICLYVILLAGASARADNATTNDDGVVTWTPSQAGSHVQATYKPGRWGMYDLEARLENAAEGKVSVTIGDKRLQATSDGTQAVVNLGRIYIDTENERTITLSTDPADKNKPLVVRSLVFAPAPEGKPIVQSGDLSITLHAHDATVHGVRLRYEFRPDKNTLGYWSNPKDWVSWDFQVIKPEKFIIVVMQGSPVAKPMQIAVADQTIDYSTKNTGSYHTFTFLEVGTITIDKPGHYTLTLKPQSPTGPVMDLRQIILLPVLK
ncbi:MAG TPA: hypothetical protein VN541_02480 [Tepidisphaeraceae bacterium]|nr:hypothetical protein [Tepidisphaeraceae bacterium]